MTTCGKCRNCGQGNYDGTRYCEKLRINVHLDDYCSWATPYDKINNCVLCGGEALVKRIGNVYCVECQTPNCFNHKRTRLFMRADSAIYTWNDESKMVAEDGNEDGNKED